VPEVRLFHARGPAMAKAWSPIIVRRVAGTTRADEDVDRRRTDPNIIQYGLPQNL